MGQALSALTFSPAAYNKGDQQGFSWARTLVAQGATWAHPLRHEYFDCDIESLNGDKKLDLVSQRAVSSPYPVTHVISRQRYAFWRSWNHISHNKENIVVLRYVKSGAFSLTQCGSKISVGPEQLVFSRTSIPFRWESLVNGPTIAEYYAVHLPLELVHHHFPDGLPLKSCLSAQPDRRLAMPTLFTLLSDQGQYLERQVVEMLVETLLKEAAEIAKQGSVEVESRKHICDKRVEDIIAYISLHLSNPDISASSVARACGISPRYLCYLLKLKGISFSDLLWEERLKQTSNWLLALDTRHYTIAEIAYMNGFKTAAHFSRLFKNYWGCSPREFRQSGGKGAECTHDRTAIGVRPHDPSVPAGSADVKLELPPSPRRVAA